MKKRGLIVLIFLLTAFAFNAKSQIKIGYTNAEFILSFMPEAKQIEAELKDYQQQLSTQLDSKMKEFQEKAAAYQRDAPNMIPEVRADKEQELQNLQQSIQKDQGLSFCHLCLLQESHSLILMT